MAVEFERQETSKKRLHIRWDNPIPTTEEPLDYPSSLKEIRGNDARPLLVMRDCDMCKGKDDALLSKSLDNERTLLYTQFFHCVKLDRRVVEKSHPWHALFSGEKPPHLFIASWDGGQVAVLPGTQSQKDLWGTMQRILKVDYQKDAMAAIKDWQRILDKFDSLDSRETELKRQITDLEEKGEAKRVASLKGDLAKIDKEREGTFAREKKVVDLVLRHAPKEKSVTDFDAEAASEVKESTPGSGLLDRIKKGEKGEPQPESKGN